MIDEFTKAAIHFRFEALRKRYSGANKCLYNFMGGYITSLFDSGVIVKEEYDRVISDLDAWLEEEDAKPKYFGDSGLYFAEIDPDKGEELMRLEE